MATANISWTACGSASNGQYLYYGKLLIATGTPVSGTGWTLYTGNPLPNTTSSATIAGLDDDVEYSFYIYCQCPTSGTGPLTTFGPLIKYVCPSGVTITPTFNGINYTVAVPSAANNSGSWIQTIVVSVLDSAGVNTILSNTFNAPFNVAMGLSSSFTGLTPSMNYNLNVAYSNSAATRTNLCSSTPFTTSPACVAPTITTSNITSNSFNVSWTPSTGGSFDILVNGSAVATGLTSTNGTYTVTGLNPATIYQIAVRLNCTTGGNAVSNTQNVTTNNSFVSAVVAVNMNPAQGSSARKTLTMSFSFPTATPTALTIYFGELFLIAQDGGTHCSEYQGYDIFSMPEPGAAPNCPFAGLIGYAPSSNLPWVITIPQGVTTYTTAVDSIYTTAGPGSNVGSSNPGGFQYAPWSVSVSAPNCVVSNIYLRVNSPSGYSSNFTIANGQNTTGIFLHNV